MILMAVQKILQEKKLVDVPITVVSKVGAGGVLGWTYLNQHPGDGRYISISPINLLTEHIAGASPITYTDVTPIAQLFNEYVAFSVRSDSSLKSGRDLAQQLRGNPASASFSVAAALGGANHIATALTMKAAGVDIRKLKFVVFNAGAQSLTAVMGGHVDVAVTPVSAAVSQLQTGRTRVIALSSPQRPQGPASVVPTWKEQGVDVVFSSFRGVIGPKAMTPDQIAYWEDVLTKVVQSEEWKRDLEKNYWESDFLTSVETTKYLKAEYERYKAVLTDLGLAKR